MGLEWPRSQKRFGQGKSNRQQAVRATEGILARGKDSAMVSDDVKVAVESAISRMREVNKTLMERLKEARLENAQLRRKLAELKPEEPTQASS